MSYPSFTFTWGSPGTRTDTLTVGHGFRVLKEDP